MGNSKGPYHGEKTLTTINRRLAVVEGEPYSTAMENFDILIYAAITVFLFSRLWAVLGRRDEDEPEDKPARPNPFARAEKRAEDEENVIVLEGRAKPVSPSVLTPEGHALDSLAGAIDQIRLKDPSFNEKKFLEGAKAAFTKIVESFAQGDMTAVVWLLGPSVRQPFEKAIAARKEAGQTLENHVEKIAAVDIVSAKMEETRATLGVEFISHQINLLRDAKGEIVDGDPGQAEEVRDLWVFQRDMTSPDPNWLLIETRS